MIVGYGTPPAPVYIFTTDIPRFFGAPMSVGQKTYICISSAYTIIMTLIFTIGWNFMVSIILAYGPAHGDPNRQTTLVTLFNSSRPINAIQLILSYSKRVTFFWSMPDTHPNRDTPNMAAKRNQSHQAAADQGPKACLADIGNMAGSGVRLPDKEGLTPENSSASYWGYWKSSLLLWGSLFVYIFFARIISNIFAGIFVPVRIMF